MIVINAQFDCRHVTWEVEAQGETLDQLEESARIYRTDWVEGSQEGISLGNLEGQLYERARLAIKHTYMRKLPLTEDEEHA